MDKDSPQDAVPGGGNDADKGAKLTGDSEEGDQPKTCTCLAKSCRVVLTSKKH